MDKKNSFMHEALANAEKARAKLLENNLLQPYRAEMEYTNSLQAIQQELKAPKNQRNSFGNYNYRSCEDILEAVKPLLQKHKCTLTISDDIVECGGRVYVKATATLITDDDNFRESTAFAREAENKKGMDDAQITGSASSYARKYALNGLFCIDDTKDADSTNTHGKEEKAKPQANKEEKTYVWNDKMETAFLEKQKKKATINDANHLKNYMKKANIQISDDDLSNLDQMMQAGDLYKKS